MKVVPAALVVFAGIVAAAPGSTAQNIAKPSAYAGVSQPPPDDTIVTDIAAPATKPVLTAQTSPAPAISASPAVAANPGPASSAAAESAQPATLQTHMPIVNPDADIVTFVPSNPGELPEGTNIHLLLNQELSTGETRSGTDFTGRVSRDVTFSGRVIVPQGSEVVGKVVRVSEGHRFGNQATIRLRPDMVVLPDGSRYVLHAMVIDANGKSRIDDEGALKPRSQLKKNAIEEGTGAGGGAAVGAVFGGPPGALIGTLVGAGVITTHILVQHPATIDVPKDTELVLSLTEAMSVNPTPSN